MATLVLSAVGATVGSSLGGSALGLSMTVVGRFAGAMVGRKLDQRLMGNGSDAVETGRPSQLRINGSGEGDAIATLYGRIRMPGHLIWASAFRETSTVTQSGGGGGGKGAPSSPATTHRSYSYSVSVALGLCEGEISGVHRIWADGAEVNLNDLNLRVYSGDREQLPDPTLEAIEGAGQVPAFRGTAYVVLENLPLEKFGNRLPQFSFEITRPATAEARAQLPAVSQVVRGVALMPGTGEYSLATKPIHYDLGLGKGINLNANSLSGKTDFATSMEMLNVELPGCKAVSLVVSWFGNDLRCGMCEIQPKVEKKWYEAKTMPWRVSGLNRADAKVVPFENGRPTYGGTPADAAVLSAIADLKTRRQAVMFYPFILMDQAADNGLVDPWSGRKHQSKLPWRGRITLSRAPGKTGTPDKTVQAENEVAQFFGTSRAEHFEVAGGEVCYTGPDEWKYRRFILHNAALCKLAGGVSAFCIGSEMRSLTQIRGANNIFPAVVALKSLAAEVRSLLGPDCQIGYAADWSEYFGYHPKDDSGDLLFHLDPLWSDENINFVGIDNYMPLSDWRDGSDHKDAHWPAIYDPAYLRSNIEGGEGYAWFYKSDADRARQRRTPITDEAHNEPWVWRVKDIRNWWSKHHFDRIDGQRQVKPTKWVPQSKPIWFTEIGCPCVDKGTNQPNKFFDAKSSESGLPYGSDGRQDDLIQAQYLSALLEYWDSPEINPLSVVYSGPMLDMARCFVWSWDVRPYPWFPGNTKLWSDGENYFCGHWLNGRVSGQTLASVVADICRQSGLQDYDVSKLFGFVRGYQLSEVSTARSYLQPLMLRYGFDAVERDGRLAFISRSGEHPITLDRDSLVVSSEVDGPIEYQRSSHIETAGRVRLTFIEADCDYDVIAEETVLPEDRTHSVAVSAMPLVMTRPEARGVVDRWLSEARIAQDTVRFVLPPSMLGVEPGDIVRFTNHPDAKRYRVDVIEHDRAQVVEAVQIEPEVYRPALYPAERAKTRSSPGLVPVFPLFLDLPLIRGDEPPHAPYLAVASDPWPGAVAVYASASDEDYVLNTVLRANAVIGVTETALHAAGVGLIDRGEELQVRLSSGSLESVTETRFFNGANLAAIGDGSSGRWELLQFRDARPLTDKTFLLSHRLRGQLGSDALMPKVWPVGSYFVLLNGNPEQIKLSPAVRDLSQHFRLGPAQRPLADPSYIHLREAFSGNGLRPYMPCHMLAKITEKGVRVSWIRRSRIDADSWQRAEVPLGEEAELYTVRLVRGGEIVHEDTVTQPLWLSRENEVSAEVLTSPMLEVHVAQVSALFGPGPFARLMLVK